MPCSPASAPVEDGTGLVASRRASQPLPLGQLSSGESYFAPIGEMRSGGERVQCHLCGGWYRMVGGSHLRNAAMLDHSRVPQCVSAERNL